MLAEARVRVLGIKRVDQQGIFRPTRSRLDFRVETGGRRQRARNPRGTHGRVLCPENHTICSPALARIEATLTLYRKANVALQRKAEKSRAIFEHRSAWLRQGHACARHAGAITSPPSRVTRALSAVQRAIARPGTNRTVGFAAFNTPGCLLPIQGGGTLDVSIRHLRRATGIVSRIRTEKQSPRRCSRVGARSARAVTFPTNPSLLVAGPRLLRLCQSKNSSRAESLCSRRPGHYSKIASFGLPENIADEHRHHEQEQGKTDQPPVRQKEKKQAWNRHRHQR